MPTTSMIPGVLVRTVLEPTPVLPGATGILGIVGVTDRGPLEPTTVGGYAEFLDQFGPASRFTMPELRDAFANGVARAVVARTAPGAGGKATLLLTDDEGDPVVKLVARAEGSWGKRLAVKVVQVRTLSGEGVKYVNLEVSLDGRPVETIGNLVMDAASDNYLFDQINARSQLLVAVDPRLATELPAGIGSTPLRAAGARAASAALKRGVGTVATATAVAAGRSGNRLAVRVTDGQASLPLVDGTGNTVLIVRARAAGADGTRIRVAVTHPSATTARLAVSSGDGAPRLTPAAASVPELVAALAHDSDVLAEAPGPDDAPLPAVADTATLVRTVDVTVFTEGADPRRHPHLATLDALAGIHDEAVRFTKVADASNLPDADTGTPLAGGGDDEPALTLAGDSHDPVVEVRARTATAAGLAVRVTHTVSSVDHLTPAVTLAIDDDGQPAEVFTDLTMDPDDERYLPRMLATSALVRGTDLFVPVHTTSAPAALGQLTPLVGGTSLLPADYQDALDRLQTAEEPDLVIASVAGQLDDAGVRAVHQQVVAHCVTMADLARNRIGVGAVTATEQAGDVKAILDHADDVRSDYFALCAPAGSAGAFAGLLAHLDYFDSPTFKTVPALGFDPPVVTDARLEQLIRGNVVAIAKRRGLGVIVAKGLATSGRQINVQRTADKAVRDVKAIAQVYIGLLNTDGSRNALLQQVSALLGQMARDGALVASTDGTSPPFTVAVHSTQADFANGIVRVDIAIRPVRAIDYINATILVRN
ncbi:hypothetical protein [Frankia gtarii]|uniref:hypothetical protein n=1 Tax=Frankia gtarii TaxID=2950102 RepID=UPI0021BF356C|nr:hypothetical protein [Frankia gtarii]